MLAYRLGFSEAARMLLAAGADAKSRTADGWESIHLAALSGNLDILRLAVVEMLKETDRAYERRVPRLLDSLAAVSLLCVNCTVFSCLADA